VAVNLKASQALQLWREVTESMVRDDGAAGLRRDLTQRQLALLLIVYLEPPPHTVRGLALRLGVTKPVITRALDTLGEVGLVERQRDPRDARNVLIRRTVAGSLMLDGLSDSITRHARLLPM
jgi:DNA-binding MarR family transcriptional regulator